MLKRKNDTEILKIKTSYHSFKKNVAEQKYNKKEICPQLDFGKINKDTNVKDYQVVTAILYRLKQGVNGDNYL